jgi:TatD DNase family protein
MSLQICSPQDFNYIDAHSHLPVDTKDRKLFLSEINKYKILTLLNGMNIASYKEAVELKKECPYLIPSFGIHPWNVMEVSGNFENLVPYIDECDFLGEIGLDYVWAKEYSFPQQRKIFDFLLSQGMEKNKVISLHTKGAELEILEKLSVYKNCNRVIIHWYSGPLDLVPLFLNLGCYFTISVDLGFSDVTEELLKMIPLNRLLIETDGITALEWINGEKSFPLYISKVAQRTASEKGMSITDLNGVIKQNFFAILGKS